MALFSPVAPRQPLFTPARPAEPGLFTAPLFTSGPATGAPAQPLPAPAAAPAPPPSMGLPLKFAHALQSFLAEEASLYAEGADPAEARQLPLRLLEEVRMPEVAVRVHLTLTSTPTLTLTLTLTLTTHPSPSP